MKRHAWVSSAVLFLLVFLLPNGASAQQSNATPVAPNAAVIAQQRNSKEARERIIKEAESAPTPKLANGHTDLSGRWTAPQLACDKTGKCQLATGIFLSGYNRFVDKNGVVHSDYSIRSLAKSDEDNEKNGASVQEFILFDFDARRAANPNKPPYKPELMAKVADLDLHANEVDPHILCHPDGPREGPPERIIENADTAVFLYANGENGNFWRIIPTDGRAHRRDLDDSYFGDSVGHWEGDTLVVDTTGYNDDSWLGGDGWFHSTDLHMIERISRKGNILHYQATFEDPQVFTRAWVKDPATLIVNSDPESEIAEVARCENQDIGHIVNHDHF